MESQKQVMVAARPSDGRIDKNMFRLEAAPVPAPGPGDVLLRTEYISVDPYLIRQLNGLGSYQSVTVGAPMFSRTIGIVVESNDAAWRPGDAALAVANWGEYNVVAAAKLFRFDAAVAPLPAFLSVMGHSGLTAWGGLLDIGRPQAGETVLVTSAAGPVGQAIGQMTRIKGARAVGIAGGEAKCRFVVDELGFDACVDYKSPDFERQLAAAVPKGIDVQCEAVGGATLDAGLVHMNRHARIVLFGFIANYDKTPLILHNADRLLDACVTLRAFSVGEYVSRWEEFQGQMGGWVRSGQVRFRDTVHQGLECAGEALLALTTGQGIGKHVIKVAP